MEKCIWSYFIFNHYFQLSIDFKFKIIGKRQEQWRVIFQKQLHPKWKCISNAKLNPRNVYYFKCEDGNIYIDNCPKDINNKITDFSKFHYERFGVGYSNNNNGRSSSNVIEYAKPFLFNWL